MPFSLDINLKVSVPMWNSVTFKSGFIYLLLSNSSVSILHQYYKLKVFCQNI